MIGQMRAVLEQYQGNGGAYWETVLPDCGHTPPLEKPEELAALVLGHWRQVGG